jgi:intron-binding protein aquarius
LAEEKGTTAPNEAVMEGVEHLGQFVYEMTVSKVKQLRAEQGLTEDDVVKATLPPIREDDEVQYADAPSDGEDEEREDVPQEAGNQAEE